MTAQLTHKEELQRQRAIALINIINDANDLRYENNRLEFIVEKQTIFIQEQRNLVLELYDEIDIRQSIDSIQHATNLEFANLNIDLNKTVIKQKSTIKTLTWVSIGLGAALGLFIIAK